MASRSSRGSILDKVDTLFPGLGVSEIDFRNPNKAVILSQYDSIVVAKRINDTTWVFDFHKASTYQGVLQNKGGLVYATSTDTFDFSNGKFLDSQPIFFDSNIDSVYANLSDEVQSRPFRIMAYQRGLNILNGQDYENSDPIPASPNVEYCTHRIALHAYQCALSIAQSCCGKGNFESVFIFHRNSDGGYTCTVTYNCRNEN